MPTVDATRMAESRASARDLVIPDVKDPIRRRDCEADDCLWLMTYCADVFYNPFTPHQEKIIADCGESLLYGTQKCKAAPRGDGKTSITKYLALKYALCRQVRFPLVVAATASKAKKTLNSLKRRLAARAESPLSDDYPLECHVARHVDPWPSRARNVTANGMRAINVEWCGDMIILPTWEAEEPLGPILLALGITSDELQGCNVYDQRPDFVILDDLDSRDSLAAEDGVIAGKIEEAVDKTIAGLGGQSRRLGQFMLCTITSRDAAAFKYSDPKQKPAWSGERIAAIQKWPTHREKWDEYIGLRQWGQGTLDDTGTPVDVFGRKAHQLYLDNRTEMDDGAVLCNPHNYENTTLPDGTQSQVSALQRCFDYIADKGIESFLTEHQNDPPETNEGESGITSNLVAKRITGLDHRELPTPCEALVSFMDVMDKVCYWTDSGWHGKGIGSFVDYGTIDVRSVPINPATGDRDRAALEMALISVFHEWREILLSKYTDATGATRLPDLCLIDSGDGQHMNAVYRFCREVGAPFYPSKGMKDGWRPPKKCIKHGDHWALVRQPDGTLLYEFEATYWKRTTHNRLLTPTFDEDNKRVDGSLALYVCPDVEQFRKDRREFSHQVTNEIWGSKKPGAKPGWIIRGKNHYLDCAAGNCLGANIAGVRLMDLLSKQRTPPGERPTAAQLAGRQ